MSPVAASVTQPIGVNAFGLAVAFAALTAFMTPVGCRMNLFAYGLSVVTPLGIEAGLKLHLSESPSTGLPTRFRTTDAKTQGRR